MTTDKFSLRRMSMLADFYTPAILSQWLWMAPVTILCYLLSLLAAHGTPNYSLYAIVQVVLSLILCWGGLAFARYHDETVETALPALASEKALFMILYSLIAVPAGIYIVWLACRGITELAGFDSNFTEIIQRQARSHFSDGLSSVDSKLGLLNYLGTALPMTVTLLTVVTARRSRVFKGVIASVLGMIGLMLVGAVYGFAISFMVVSKIPEGAPINESVLGNAFIEVINSTSTVTAIIGYSLALISLAVVLCMIFNRVKNRQV